MKFRILLVPAIVFYHFLAEAQLVPAPGAKLNYTQIMFEYPKVKDAEMYVVQVSKESETFNGAMEQKDSSIATMINGLDFGFKYQWRYAGIKNGNVLPWNGPYNFETISDSFFGQSIMSLHVLRNDTSKTGGLIAMDCTHSVLDRTGKVIWYLPKINWRLTPVRKKFEMRPQILDMKITPYGTVTFLSDSDAFESDLQGNIIWKAPNDGKISGNNNEAYNHDFKRLPNGNYMVLGVQQWKKLPTTYDSVLMNKKFPFRQVRNGKEYAKVEFGTVIEYNKRKEIVWSWNSDNYFDKDWRSPERDSSDYELRAHMNAFSVDNKNEFVYGGFRDIDRIIKINKKTGQVVNSWGSKMPSGEAREPGYFHKQHDARILNDGTIAVFNNDNTPVDSPSSVIIFSQPTANQKSEVKWQFVCSFDTMAGYRHGGNGGNVEELSNHHFLVCMGNGDRIFEITRDKQIVWDGIVESPESSTYLFTHRLYRAHYISSLYPCYFTCETNSDTVTQKTSAFTLKVFNEGTDDDSYLIKISSGKGAYQKQITTSVLHSNRSASFDVTPVKATSGPDKIQIVVQSKTNPDLERKIFVQFRN
ncbi:MAG: hypothetical protein JWO06_2122 [Bacteroidota bacterium]|nr:hypothetical protein [Bacteroidota bacterium]